MALSQISLAFVGLVFGLYLYSLAALRFAAAARVGQVMITALGQLVWLALLGWLAGSGRLVSDVTQTPPLLVLWVVLPALLLVLLWTFAPAVAKPWLATARGDWLASVQVVRAPVALLMYALFREGLVPTHLTFAGWDYGIVIGLLALPVGYLDHKRRAPRGLLWGFHLLGTGLLLWSFGLELLSAPTSLQVFTDPPGLGLIFHVPFVWLLGYVQPLLLTCHLLALRRLLRSSPTP